MVSSVLRGSVGSRSLACSECQCLLATSDDQQLGCSIIAQALCHIKEQKKHINIFSINFLAPPQTPHFGPPEKSLCASSPGKERKKRDELFRGDFWVKKGVPIRPVSATKSLVYCFSLHMCVGKPGSYFDHFLESPREPRQLKP